MALLTRQTPEHIEATAISFFTSFFSLAKLISTLLGALLGYLFNIQSSNYTKMYPIVLIQCLYATFTTFGVFFIKFPKTKHLIGEEGHEVSIHQSIQQIQKNRSIFYTNNTFEKNSGIKVGNKSNISKTWQIKIKNNNFKSNNNFPLLIEGR